MGNDSIMTEATVLDEAGLDRASLFGFFPDSLAKHDRAKEGFDGAIRVYSDLTAAFTEIDEDPTSMDPAKDTAKRQFLAKLGPKLKSLGTLHDQLLGAMHTAEKSFAPTLPDDPARSTAIWSLLPNDAMDMQTLAQDSIEAGHWDVVNAIISLPVIHPSVLAPELLAELHDRRVLKENPELAVRIDRARDAAALVGSATRTVNEIVGEQVRELGPEPEPEPERGRGGASGFTKHEGPHLRETGGRPPAGFTRR